MANRRMFSLDVVDTDFFLEMPSTARLLYYDLGMRCDDDGFVSPMKVVRMTGASGDDLKILIAKGFAYLFEDGVIVLLHWLRNNKIDASKYTPSIYHPRLRDIIETGVYVSKLPAGRKKEAIEATEKGPLKGPLKGPEKGPQYRIGKDSIDKDITPISPLPEKLISSENDGCPAPTGAVAPATLTPNSAKWFDLWYSLMGFPITRKPIDNQKALNGLVRSYGKDEVRHALEALAYAKKQPKKNQPYFVQYTTSFMKVRDNWDNIQAYMSSEIQQSYVTTIL